MSVDRWRALYRLKDGTAPRCAKLRCALTPPPHPPAGSGGALSSLFNFGSRPTTPQIHMTDSDNARGSGVGSGSGSGGDGESGGESDGGGPPSLEKAGGRRGSFSGRSGPLGGAAATEKKSRRAMMRLKHEAQGYEKMRKLPEGVLSMKPVRPNDFSEWHASVSQLQELDVITIHVPDNYPFTGPETVFKGYTIRFVLGMSNLSENELHQNEVNNIFLVSWTPAQVGCAACAFPTHPTPATAAPPHLRYFQNLLDAVTSTQQLVRRFQVEDKEREQREVAAVKASAAIAKQSEAYVGATEMETIPISVAPVAGNTPRPDDGGIGAAPIPGGLQTIQSAAEIESMLSEASTAGDDGGVGERGSTGAENSGVLGAAADTPPAHAEILT
mmetsp:Transcript_98656/g.281991  ORF Transcript_98656/g.281991 Transcript_98656/m.281991 type:complete len:386 (-) Transcript_98656:99-1256(-)